MKKNVIIFLFIFSVDIRVRAEVAAHQAPYLIQEPEACLNGFGLCTLKSIEKYSIKNSTAILSLKKNTVLMRQALDKWALVAGNIFVNSKKEVSIVTPYGDMRIHPDAKVLIDKRENDYFVRVISGKVFLKGLGHANEVAVLEGYQNTLGRVGESARAEIAIPKPVLFIQAIKDWGSHFEGEQKEFRSEVENFKIIYKRATEELSELNRQIVQREVASHEERLNKARQKRVQKEAFERQKQENAVSRLLGE